MTLALMPLTVSSVPLSSLRHSDSVHSYQHSVLLIAASLSCLLLLVWLVTVATELHKSTSTAFSSTTMEDLNLDVTVCPLELFSQCGCAESDGDVGDDSVDASLQVRGFPLLCLRD